MEKAEADGSVQNLLDTKHSNATTLKYLKRINTKNHPYNERHGEQRAVEELCSYGTHTQRWTLGNTVENAVHMTSISIPSSPSLDHKMIKGHIEDATQSMDTVGNREFSSNVIKKNQTVSNLYFTKKTQKTTRGGCVLGPTAVSWCSVTWLSYFPQLCSQQEPGDCAAMYWWQLLLIGTLVLLQAPRAQPCYIST